MSLYRIPRICFLCLNSDKIALALENVLMSPITIILVVAICVVAQTFCVQCVMTKR